MGPAQPRGGFLWYFKTGAWQHGIDFLQGEDFSKLVSGAVQLNCLHSSVAHRKRVYPVKIRRTSSHSGSDSGVALQADLLRDGDVGNGDVYSLRKKEDLEHAYCTAFSSYEDTVAVVSGSHVYVSSPTCLGRKLRGGLNSTRLGEYMRLALEDELIEHVLPLTEVSGGPKLISSAETVVSVACGTEHVLLCTNTGRLYSMGSNRHGQLGRSTRNSDTVGWGVVHLVDENSSSGNGGSCSPAAVKVYAGSNFSFVIARKRSMLTKPVDFSSFACVGGSAEGTAPGAKQSPSASTSQPTPPSAAHRKEATVWSESATPRVEHTLPAVPSRALPSRAENSCLDSELCHSLGDGKGETLYSWGCNDYGQLGHGTKESTLKPVQVKQPEEVSSWNSVAAGFAHVVVLSGTNTVYSCGLNLHGQLGLGTTREETSLRKIDLPEPVEQISCGTWHTLFLTSNGHLLTAGRPPEFPYTSWLQSVASPLAVKDNAYAERLLATTFSVKITGSKIQAPAPTSNLKVKAEPPTRGAAVLSSSQHILLSTTRHLCRSGVDTNTLVQARSSTSSGLCGRESSENIPFAHSPGILRIKGFRDDLQCISAGETTSAAVGFDEHTKRYRLYVWKAADPREYPENWLFMCDVYDPSPLLEFADDTERTAVACRCAPSGVYLWTKTSELCISSTQS